ncbi:hypothetical protein FEM41_14680 [Jejubacter calystegiae]|uniref:Uncharacterized protein n=1 Tax=Jejubacter calystegiae TaxID=2579935 RepID=A0A4P8YKX4_9ENTR|nr:hypothetical protein [Jejubacter calystegiae]QCT20803.1 hypothetical protein FEM41_14680 [Jejubacter calystegiae]
MDIKELLKAIAETKEQIESARYLIGLKRDGHIYRIGLYACPSHGRDVTLPVEADVIFNVAEERLNILTAKLERLQDAQRTAERVIGGILSETNA